MAYSSSRAGLQQQLISYVVLLLAAIGALLMPCLDHVVEMSLVLDLQAAWLQHWNCP